MTDGEQKSGKGAALLFTGMGVFMMIMIALEPEGLHVPLWVGEIAAATFVFAGIALLGQYLGLPVLARLGGICAVYALAVPGLWIMLDPGPKACAGSISFQFFSSGAALGDMGCRLIFGAGAIITVICALLMTIAALRPSSR